MRQEGSKSHNGKVNIVKGLKNDVIKLIKTSECNRKNKMIISPNGPNRGSIGLIM